MLVDDTELPNIPPNATRPLPHPVEGWRDTAAINYLSESEIRDSRVEGINWYKSKEGMEHEYLVMECRRPRGVVFYMRIERQPANHEALSVSTAVSPGTNHTPSIQQQLPRKNFCKRILWTVLQKLAERSKPKVAALDSVSQVLNSTGSFGETPREIARYSGFRNPLFVRDLAFLSCAVHSYQPNYQLFLYQCYWYCRTIVDVAVAEYEPTVIHGEYFREAGTYTITKRWLGSHRLPVNQHFGHEVDRIRRNFKVALEAHNAEVRQRENEQNRKRQKLERRLWELEGLSGSHSQVVVRNA